VAANAPVAPAHNAQTVDKKTIRLWTLDMAQLLLKTISANLTICPLPLSIANIQSPFAPSAGAL
jgi:hypothetical protein